MARLRARSRIASNAGPHRNSKRNGSPLADPARPIRVHRAQARLRALHHRRSVRVPGQGARVAPCCTGAIATICAGPGWTRGRSHAPGSRWSLWSVFIAEIVAEHPEYHAALESADALTREYPPEADRPNPFLHMALHMAVREQLTTDRPRGVRDLYAKALPRFADAHWLEHTFMECLAETIWDAQRTGTVPDEARYLDRLRAHREAGLDMMVVSSGYVSLVSACTRCVVRCERALTIILGVVRYVSPSRLPCKWDGLPIGLLREPFISPEQVPARSLCLTTPAYGFPDS